LCFSSLVARQIDADHGTVMPMRVLGVDLAAQPRKTYACVLDDTEGLLRAELHGHCDDARLLALAKGRRKVAIDAPFGWPNAFVDALNAHRAADAWPAPDSEDPDVFRASLSFRATDRVVMHTRRPLSVSTDKLGVTAMRCAHLLHRWSAGELVDRTGRGRFVEVYPAAALARWGLATSGYKGGRNRRALGDLVANLHAALPSLQLDSATRRVCAASDDAFDALVAALVARAASLGLTDGPPKDLRMQAAEEGWIHLPVRGSLPFLDRKKALLGARPADAIRERLRERGVDVDTHGYVRSIDDVFVPTLSEAQRTAIKADLIGKGGSELKQRRGRLPKFHAVHSSAALAANSFGAFLRNHAEVPVAGTLFPGTVQLEVRCPTGLRGTPPTLDCLVEGPTVLAIESKFLESFSTHTARFSDAYRNAMASMHPSWRAELSRLVEDTARYRHLDAAQLVKHYLGLKAIYSERPVMLLYLYWSPTNAEDVAACAIHRAELDEFNHSVRDPRVRLALMTYAELWDDWSSAHQPPWLRKHAKALQARYEMAI
jgi:hypothetical protein